MAKTPPATAAKNKPAAQAPATEAPKAATTTKAAKEAPKAPSVGRIVHYHSEKGAAPQAAMVTDAKKMVATLNVMPPGRTNFHVEDVPHQDDVKDSEAYWNYPPIV